MARCLGTGFSLRVLTCGKVILVQANTIPERPEYNLLESGKAESKVGTFNCWGQTTLALWEDGEEQRLLTIGGSRCCHQPGEAPGCARHWEAACPLARGDGAVPWFIRASPSLSSLERSRSCAFEKSNSSAEFRT